MAVGAFFCDVGVLVDKRSLILHVTTSAKRLGGNAFEVAAIVGEVRIVTFGAGHLMLRHRMMGELRELHLDLGVTLGAKFFLLVPTHLLLRPFV